MYIDCLTVFLAMGVAIASFFLGFCTGGVITNEAWKDKLRREKENQAE